MKKVKMYFRKLSIPEKIQKARNLVARMDGNVSFSNPVPSLTEVSKAADALENAYEEALNGGKLQIAQQRQCESVLDTLIVSLAGYVQSASFGDETVIISSGFDVHKDRSPVRNIGTPQNISGKAGAKDGEVAVSWDRVPGAKAYNIQMSPDGNNSWTFCGTATRSQFLCTGLDSGSKCFFRVAAIGPLGQSGWSDPGFGKAL